MVGAIVVEAGRGGARLRPRINPHLAIVFGVAAGFHLRFDEPGVRAAGRGLLRGALVDRLLARRQKLVEHEEVVARVAQRRILAQLPFGDERMRAVDDDELLEHLGVIHREDPRDVGAPVVGDEDEFLVLAADLLGELPHVLDEMRHRVRLEPFRPRRQVVAAHVEADREMIAAHLRHLILPLVPEGRIAVQEQDERSLADARVVQTHAVHVRVVVLEWWPGALRSCSGRHTRRQKRAEHQRAALYVSHVSPHSSGPRRYQTERTWAYSRIRSSLVTIAASLSRAVATMIWSAGSPWNG